jgi:hypothetical protein
MGVKAKRPKEAPRPSDCFELKAAALYRQEYSSKPPAPGTMAWLTEGQLRSANEAINAALRRGAIRLVDAREEQAVIKAALQIANGTASVVPVRISDEPFRIREPRKATSKSKRKKRKR